MKDSLALYIYSISSIRKQILFKVFLIIILPFNVTNCNDINSSNKQQNNSTEEYYPVQLSKEKSDNLKMHFNRYIQYFNSKQFDKVMDYIYPLLFEEMMKLNNFSFEEAKKIAAKMTKKEMEEIGTKGYTTKKMQIIAMSNTYIGHNNKIYTTISNSLTIEHEGKETTKLSKTIAISMDKGENWYFLEYGEDTRELLKELPENAFNIL